MIILLNQVPPEIVSTNEALLVRFKSDDTINSKGFSAAYVAIDENENEDLPKSQQSVRYNWEKTIKKNIIIKCEEQQTFGNV